MDSEDPGQCGDLADPLAGAFHIPLIADVSFITAEVCIGIEGH